MQASGLRLDGSIMAFYNYICDIAVLERLILVFDLVRHVCFRLFKMLRLRAYLLKRYIYSWYFWRKHVDTPSAFVFCLAPVNIPNKMSRISLWH